MFFIFFHFTKTIETIKFFEAKSLCFMKLFVYVFIALVLYQLSSFTIWLTVWYNLNILCNCFLFLWFCGLIYQSSCFIVDADWLWSYGYKQKWVIRIYNCDVYIISYLGIPILNKYFMKVRSGRNKIVYKVVLLSC